MLTIEDNSLDLEHKYNVVLRNLSCMIDTYDKLGMNDMVQKLTKVQKDIVGIFVDIF